VVDLDNGQRLETYCIPGPEGGGQVCLNGAAARLVAKGDKVIIMAFASMTPIEADGFSPKVVFVDQNNSVTKVSSMEVHGPSPQEN
jgi:aspartate 1-decarboxylase